MHLCACSEAAAAAAQDAVAVLLRLAGGICAFLCFVDGDEIIFCQNSPELQRYDDAHSLKYYLPDIISRMIYLSVFLVHI